MGKGDRGVFFNFTDNATMELILEATGRTTEFSIPPSKQLLSTDVHQEDSVFYLLSRR